MRARQGIKKPPDIVKRLELLMAETTRLELATSGVTGRRSNQLNYVSITYTNFL
jgi:hypothetical protein